MKYVILICDGAADYPLKQLGNKTPFQLAKKPHMDEIAKKGCTGLVKTVPEGYIPGSDVANLSLLGYDPDKYFPGGRGVIEAASMGIEVSQEQVPMRTNIITVSDGKIKDYSAANIKNDEARALIDEANRVFGSEKIKFYPGVSYRNLLVITDGNLNPQDFSFDAPHDYPGGPVKDHLARGQKSAKGWAKKLNDIMLKSQEVFEQHEVNLKRVEQGIAPANMLWFWGPGKKKADMPPIKERFGISGGVITGIDLIRGLGKLAGLDIWNVSGATAYYDTNYEGKADAAIKGLNSGADLAVIHVEAPDEAGHEGEVDEKVRAIENIDSRLISRVMDGIEDEFRIAILPDHYTSIDSRKHEMDPVPFAIMGPGISADSVECFDEESVKSGGYGLKKGPNLMELLTAK